MTRDENPYTPPSDHKSLVEPASHETKKSNRNLVGLIVSAAVALAAPPVGVVVSVLFLNLAFQGTEGTDPSQKARVLGNGISEARNGAAGGLIVSFAALVSAIVFAVRLIRAPTRG